MAEHIYTIYPRTDTIAHFSFESSCDTEAAQLTFYLKFIWNIRNSCSQREHSAEKHDITELANKFHVIF